KAPQVDDILTAYAVGGRWVAELTANPKGEGCIQFLGCNGTPLVGVQVRIYYREGGTLIAGPLTSDANGKVCPELPSGTYWIDPTSAYDFPLDKYEWIPAYFGIPAKGTVVWIPPLVAGYGCCAGVTFPLPLTLYLTVCGQTFSLVSPTINITGWAPVGGTANIFTPRVAVVNNCNLGGWDGFSTSPQPVPFAIRLLCPSGDSMLGLTGVCGIGHYNRLIGGFDAYAICPAACTGGGNAYTCCNGSASPGAGVPFTL